ncbi:DUF5627 domain-containing protein [Dyadobacter sp. CY312]|uniref:DUF5627 domain-containing protein n=1 Tax=Dyadobacter sp. CY312 TaxID=2907303 RepID=UPI001F1B69C1|nr:DUF5627 domain-containing protein [Dyadobacter sp. CY312]MCE7040165.1 DUF5627 domain-containing protein [Dyadobacter sp. CY312]
MKRICLYLALLTGMFSCKNADIVHPDFDYTAGYFPYQYPVRTLILGDDIYDNSNDNAHKFVISAAMGGVYENGKDRNFEIAVDETLCRNILFNANGDTIRPLPRNYYTLSSTNSLVIPKGKFNGGIEVQLTDAFFNDPKAIKLGYVVPLKLVGSPDVDSIVSGRTTNPNADPRVAGNWTVAPKNFTMFAIKYINEFHGNYFFHGETSVTDSTGALIEQKVYKAQYVEQNGVILLTTSGRNQVAYNTSFQSDKLSGQLRLLLNFTNGKCTVTSASPDYTVTGTGEFKTGAFEWGNKARNGIELNYTVVKGKNTYQAKETLVARDRGVVMEVYAPRVF